MQVHFHCVPAILGSIRHSPSDRLHPRGLFTSDTQQTEMGVLAWINSAFSFRQIAPQGLVYIRYVADRDGCTGVDQCSILLQIDCTLRDCLHQIRSRQRWVYWRGQHSPLYRQIAPSGIVSDRYVEDRNGCTGVDRILLQIDSTLGDCLHQIRSRQRWVYWRGSIRHSPSDRMHPRGLFTSDTQQTEMGVLAWINSAFSFRQIAPQGIVYIRYVADRDGCVGVLAWINSAFSFREKHTRGLLRSCTQQTEMRVLTWINSAFSFRQIAPQGIVYIR